MLECERALDGRTRVGGQAACDLGVAVRADERPDARDLLVGRGRIPRAHDFRERLRRPRVGEVEPFEDHVRHVADLGRGQPGLATAVAERRLRFAQADDPLGVEAVRAHLEQGERAVREAADAVLRRRGHGKQLGQLRRLRDRHRAVLDREQGQLRFVVAGGGGLGSRGRIPVDPQDELRPVPVDLDRSPGRHIELAAPGAGRAPSRSASSRLPHARGRSSRKRSAGRSRASSRRSRGAGARPRPPRPRAPSPPGSPRSGDACPSTGRRRGTRGVRPAGRGSRRRRATRRDVPRRPRRRP